MESEYVRRVNREITQKVNPMYNLFLIICAGGFGYFVYNEENQCYARDKNAWAVEYENTEDVTHQFDLLCNSGFTLLLVGCLLYYMQSKLEMHDIMRPYVIMLNLITFVWFMFLQYYRFKETGKACSGDYISGKEKPENFDSTYLVD